MDKPKELEEKWRESFEKETDFEEADSLLQYTIQKGETDALLRIAVETALVLRPETKDDFIEAVENAGEKLFVIEVGVPVLAIAAAMLIGEAYKRGRASEIKIKKYNDRSILIEERTETKFANGGPFASLLAKIGLGQL